MKSLVINFFFLLSCINVAFSTDQLHDILIIGKDTIFLKTFPLEELGFQIRPFRYGNYDYPNPYCFRGYQATWKVVGKKLYLVEVAKVDAYQEKLDIQKYFAENGYTPTVIDGWVFADWFSMDLVSFPRQYKYLGCVWKSKKPGKQKTSLRCDKGILVMNNYNPGKHRA